MSLTDVIVGAVVGGCIGIAGGVVAVKYEWRRHIDFVCIKEIYAPLHAKIIEIRNSLTKFVGISPGDVETFVRRIKDNYWYPRVSKKVAEKFQEWQSRVSEYDTIRRDMEGKIEKVITQEIEKREASLEPSPDKAHVVFEFKRIIKEGFLYPMSTGYFLLIRGEINDEEYHFIDNFKRGGNPLVHEIKVNLASGFPKAIYEEIQKDPLFTNLHDKVTEVEGTTARLREVLEKQKKNRFMRRFYIFKKKSI